MKSIGLFSDTHSFLPHSIFDFFKDCDEVWHAGDIGNEKVAEKMEAFKPFKAVYGNIDAKPIRGNRSKSWSWSFYSKGRHGTFGQKKEFSRC